jgi:protoporphyrinogen oxidase
MKIAVIGAGPAGMTAGYQLSKEIAGGKVETLDVFEVAPQVGGLAKSFELWDQIVDLGPHRFFSNDTRVNEFWLEVADGDYDLVDRLTRIYYKKRFFHYPLKPTNALVNLGLFTATRCMMSYMAERISPTKDTSTFEGWVKSRFGKRLFEIFFKTYSEKLWGITCEELDADFAAQRIKKLSLWEAIKNAMFAGKGNKHKTLVDQFAFPTEGTGLIYDKMAAKCIENGGKVHLNTPVQRLITNGKKVTGIELENGEIREYDHVISSMPISLLTTRIDGIPEEIKEAANGLKFRNTVLVYLHIDGKDLFPDQWLYIHSNEMETGRITNFSNWLPSINKGQESTILCLEYWCNFEDQMWADEDATLIELATQDIKKTGLIGDSKVMDGMVVKIPRCYPVYYSGYKAQLKPVEEYLATFEGLQVIGRYGAYKYNNQDHSILMGLLAAENALKGTDHNLWQVNTDYEDYQEASVITKTGLAKVEA